MQNEITMDEINNLMTMFNRYVVNQPFSDALISSALDLTNLEASDNGLNCFISDMHIDMSGSLQIIVRRISDATNMTVIDGGIVFPAGVQNDYSTSVAIETLMQNLQVSSFGKSNENENWDSGLYIDVDIPDDTSSLTLTDSESEDISLLSERVRVKVEEYIISNFTESEVRSYGSYIYDIIDQKIYDYAEKYGQYMYDDCPLPFTCTAEMYRNEILNNVSLNDFYDFIDEFIKVTPQDILREVCNQ